MKKLLVFGDSWPAGAELSNPSADAFPIILAKKLNLICENRSKSATSIDHAVLEFLKSDLTNAVVLFCVTGYSRSMYFDRGTVWEVHPSNAELEWYYTKMYSDELGQLNRLKNCLLIQEICINRGIPVYFVSNWDTVPTHTLLDSKLWAQQTLIQTICKKPYKVTGSTVDWLSIDRSDRINMTNNHPNAAGHHLIAEELYKWINSVSTTN